MDRSGSAIDEATSLARANNEHPPVAFRLNPLRAPSLARVLEELSASGVDVRESAIAPGAFVVAGGHLTPSSRAIREGMGLRAGRGVAARRLARRRASRRARARHRRGAGRQDVGDGRRDGQHGTDRRRRRAPVASGDARTRRAVASRRITCRRSPQTRHSACRSTVRDVFDRVLVDAPCSGTGTLRRNPEIKWRLAAVDLERFAGLQSALLETAAGRVRAGGRLVYSTCFDRARGGRGRRRRRSGDASRVRTHRSGCSGVGPNAGRICPDVSASSRRGRVFRGGVRTDRLSRDGIQRRLDRAPSGSAESAS